MVLESTDGPFGNVGTMLIGGYLLELNSVLLERLLEVIGTFVVKDVEVHGMSLEKKHFVGFLPGGPECGALMVGNAMVWIVFVS